MIDVLADVVQTIGIGGSVFAHHEISPPWGLHFGKTQQARFHIVSQGTCWLRLDENDTFVQLVQGDVVFLPHGVGHCVVDQPTTPVIEIMTSANGCEEGTILKQDGEGPITAVVCGGYSFDLNVRHPLLWALPPLIHLPASQTARDDDLHTVARLLAKEVELHPQGAQVVMDRLVDALLMYLLRTWLDQQLACRSGWFGALRDSQIGKVLALMHEMPGRDWTVESLGASVGLSRAAFARRFCSEVGEPPMIYLTRWRMAIATKLLRDSDHPLTGIAERVGYESEFSFAKAFKRFYGEPPGAYRKRAHY